MIEHPEEGAEMRHITLKLRQSAAVLAILGGILLADNSVQSEEFRLSEPVVCRTINGFRDYVKLEPAELTTFDKLLVYVEPQGFATRPDAEKIRAELIQGARLRAKGSKKPIFEREELFKYDPVIESSGQQIYLGATIGFKNLKPGLYQLDLTTTDRAAQPEKRAVQTIEFRIIESAQ